MKRTPVDNTMALDTFLAAKLEIDALLERLKPLRNDHFNADPDQINWGAPRKIAPDLTAV